ncbi:hypothetical protein C0585_03300 [Candidatus Woesearchaeota archaeon]|nr:MAG: hypothetical protein C0585_03300 [Candidatus Woesearchaeota archaeon]
MKILIAHASRYGNCEEVSKYIAKKLKADVINIEKENPNVENYDLVVFGAGIKIGRITKKSRKFLENDFKNIAIFVTCGEAYRDEKKAISEYIDPIGKKFIAKAAFGPVFDFTKNSKMNFIEKFIVRKINEKEGTPLDYSKYNDLRDWKKIDNFISNLKKVSI